MGETEVGIKDSEFHGSCSLPAMVHLGFSSIAALFKQLIGKEEHFVWTVACEYSFEALKDRFTSAPILSLLEGHDDFVVYSNTSGIRLVYLLIQRA